MTQAKRREESRPDYRGRAFRYVPHLVAIAYAILSTCWIVFSDRVLAALARSPHEYGTYQTFKGTAFILASSVIIFLMLKGAWKRMFAAYDSLVASEQRTQLALAVAGGGVWEVELTEDFSSKAFISAEFAAKLGFPPDQPLSVAEWRERQHPEDVGLVETAMAETIASNGARPFDVTYRIRAFDGGYRWLHSRGGLVADGRSRKLVAVSLDVSEQMEAMQRIDHLLRYDAATGLAKSEWFVEELDQLIAGAAPGAVVGVMKLKLLDLALMTDQSESAEEAGIIQLVGERMHDLASGGMLAGRDGTDVFNVATPPLASAAAVARMLQSAFRELSRPYHHNGRDLRPRFTAGAALFPQDGDGAQVLVRDCRHALDADSTVSGAINWFTEGLDTELKLRNERLGDLATAVEKDEIVCHFQPLVDLRTGEIKGLEALARWQRGEEGLLPPDQFIPLAEEFGHIAAIGEDVLRKACRAAIGWASETGKEPFVAVNVSPAQLDDPAFASVVARVLAETGLSPRRLELEITESALPANPDAASKRLHSLRGLGVAIALDDFGTGYSSLSILGKLPFDRLKIDRSFVAGYGQLNESTMIADMIIELGNHLDLAITAEGVETFEQVVSLRARRVELAQGYWFSRPVPAHEVAGLLRRHFHLTEHPRRNLPAAGR